MSAFGSGSSSATETATASAFDSRTGSGIAMKSEFGWTTVFAFESGSASE